MGLRFGIARAIGSISSRVLADVLNRPAGNFPGKAALYADPALISDLRPRLREGAVCVVGTNGKTTVTNLLADAFEAAGRTVACNRTGANLDSGVATALLRAHEADWGVFEVDELWLSGVAARLRPDYVVLLNLFRDQLDRVGEIDRTQRSIEAALQASPSTVLVYNADDPFCQAIADAVGNRAVPFGIGEEMGLSQDTVADAGMCQRCSAMLEYSWRQYGQLGGYRCRACGFGRSGPMFEARDVKLSEGGASFTFCTGAGGQTRVSTAFSSAYMAYDVLAVCAAADLCGVSVAAVQRALDAFDPHNGRLQSFDIDGAEVLLNLAKNPTGFNQNLRIVTAGAGPKAVAFFVNDKEADGHDVSWLWDVDFQGLAGRDIAAFAGGMRRNDVQVRLKYAGVETALVDGAADFLGKAQAAMPGAKAYAIANYTALSGVKAELERLQASGMRLVSVPSRSLSDSGPSPAASASSVPVSSFESARPFDSAQSPEPAHAFGFAQLPEPLPSHEPALSPDFAPSLSLSPGFASSSPSSGSHSTLAWNTGGKLVIAHLFPALLNLYGDGGNVTVLEQRARARGIDAEVVRADGGDFDFDRVDIVFLGGGPDREQEAACAGLLEMRDGLRAYVEDDGVLLAICGGFQILGSEWLSSSGPVAGLGLVEMSTRREEGGSRNRLVGDIVLDSPLARMPVVGYENHAGRTYLGRDCEPFGRVMGSHGKGNNGHDGGDGVLWRNVVGTYLHGPLLAKNPEVADELIRRALERRARKAGAAAVHLDDLPDAEERAANAFMLSRLGVRKARR